MSRDPALSKLLLSCGVQDLAKATRTLAYPELQGWEPADLAAGLALAGSPDAALLGLVRVLETAPDWSEPLRRDSAATTRLVRLLGASGAVADWLVRHPGWIRDVVEAPRTPDAPSREEVLESMRRDVRENGAADPEGPQGALRAAYRRRLLRVLLRDIEHPDPMAAVPQVARELADLAAGCLQLALEAARERVAAEAAEPEGFRFAVIGMGKCGAGELNYISDVDVMYVADGHDEPAAVEWGTRVAKEVGRLLMAPGTEPMLWEVDANLRPEGADGALVRTLDSYRDYYRNWAHDWEFQALLKARPVAGDPELGRGFHEMAAPLVADSSQRAGFVGSVQKMRQRVIGNMHPAEAKRNIKLGRGGLRDIEFAVQLLQLVHGRTSPAVGEPGTLAALASLAEDGYVNRDDAEVFSADYRFLRTLEHRVQMLRMRRTHLFPLQEEEARWVARLMGAGNDTEELRKRWAQVRRNVLGIHEKLFFRPVLRAVAGLSAEVASLQPQAAAHRMAALGFKFPDQGLRHIQALTRGVSRRAAIQRQLLPAFLEWFADGVDPDYALLSFRRISEQLGQAPWFLRMMRDSGAAAERLALVVGQSKMATALMEHQPEAVSWLDDDERLRPRDARDLSTELARTAARHSVFQAAARTIRSLRRRELLRIALGDAVGVLDAAGVRQGLSELTVCVLEAMLDLARRETGARVEFCIIGMGRFGGGELVYGSDADVLHVYRGDAPEARQEAEKLHRALREGLAMPLSPPLPGEVPLELDAALRPEGKNGPLVRSLGSFAEYYGKWVRPWEIQALVRAAPVAGDPGLAQEFTHLIDPLRYGPAFDDAALLEVRRLKARMEKERLPRGADPKRHLKLGPGGLSDVEWLVQLHQLRHAHALAGLRTTSTLDALEVLAGAGMLSADEEETLSQAWTVCSQARSAVRLWSGKNSDSLPLPGQDLEAVARLCGWDPGHMAEFEDEVLGAMRRGRTLFEELFYDG